MSKNLVNLHVLIEKEDLDLMTAFSPNHGDLSFMVRHLIHTFCTDIKKGGKAEVMPPEIISQIEGYKMEDNSENEG